MCSARTAEVAVVAEVCYLDFQHFHDRGRSSVTGVQRGNRNEMECTSNVTGAKGICRRVPRVHRSAPGR